MVAYALANSDSTRISDAETLARNTADERLARSSTVERHIADDNILISPESRTLRRSEYQLSARKSLSEIIIAVPDKLKREPLGDKRAEALSAAARTFNSIGVIRK